MEEDDAMHTCDQCGSKVAMTELIVDEETGLLVCPLCSQELESCGCSDDDHDC